MLIANLMHLRTAPSNLGLWGSPQFKTFLQVLAVLEGMFSGVIMKLPTQTMHCYKGIPQNYHKFMLFDFSPNGKFNDPWFWECFGDVFWRCLN